MRLELLVGLAGRGVRGHIADPQAVVLLQGDLMHIIQCRCICVCMYIYIYVYIYLYRSLYFSLSKSIHQSIYV